MKQVDKTISSLLPGVSALCLDSALDSPCWCSGLCTVTPRCAGPWSKLKWLPLKTAAKDVSESILSKFRSLFTPGGLSQQKPVPTDHVSTLIKSLKGLSCRYPNHDGAGVLRIESMCVSSCALSAMSQHANSPRQVLLRLVRIEMFLRPKAAVRCREERIEVCTARGPSSHKQASPSTRLE